MGVVEEVEVAQRRREVWAWWLTRVWAVAGAEAQELGQEFAAIKGKVRGVESKGVGWGEIFC